MTTVKPGVLLVMGAYYPELSGAGLQTRSLVRTLADRVDFTVLTTTADASLALADRQDGIEVYRIPVNPASAWSKLAAIVRFTSVFVRLSRRFSIVHLHGFSQKSILVVALARLARKKIAIKLTSLGHDDPVSMSRRGRIAYACYAKADAFFGVSPGFGDAYDASGLPPHRFYLMPNGVDAARFRPGTAEDRAALRRDLQLPAASRIVLFVGFFSRDKRPDAVFEAWAAVAASIPDSVLVFVGATRTPYYEIDPTLADEIRLRAAASDLRDRVRFVESTDVVERFTRAADVFVLASVREGMPNALLEAMSTGLPCISTRITGVTDVLIEEGRNGLLIPPDDRAGLEQALRRLLENPPWAARLGCEARRTIEAGFTLERAAARYLDAYHQLVEA